MMKRNCMTKRLVGVFIGMMLGTGAIWAAPSETYMCYKPTAGLSDYPWEKTKWWFDSVNSAPTLDRVPTASDIVFLYSSKNNVLNGMPPMRIGEGVSAKTGKLIVCDTSNGPTYQIGIRVENGGEMENHGDVFVGSGTSATKNAGGGFFEVESGGVWTAYGNFSLGISPRSSTLDVKSGGVFSCTNGEFVVAQGFGAGIVTNAGAMVLKDCFVGGEYAGAKGSFIHDGTLGISNKLTIARRDNTEGLLHLRSGSRLVKTAWTKTNQPIHIGYQGHGKMVVDGELEITGGSEVITLGFSPENSTGGHGELVVNDAVVTNVYGLYIGRRGKPSGGKVHGGRGEVVLNGSAALLNSVMQVNLGGLGESSLTLNGTSRLDAVTNFTVQAVEENSRATLRMHGGSIAFRATESMSQYHLCLGSSAAMGDRIEVRGWGTFMPTAGTSYSNMLRITPYARMIADGEDEPRDLDFRGFRTVGSQTTDYNSGGYSNGWYAVNKGRILFPAQQEVRAERKKVCVGQHPWASQPNLVNAFQVAFAYTDSSDAYFHAELHAPDRTEIPAGLGNGLVASHHVQGVWRIGFFNKRGLSGREAQNTWSNATVTFRYDAAGLEEGWMVKLLHHDGTATGSWRTVGQRVHDPANCLISDASPRKPGAGEYNFGWYAVVAYKKSGLLVIVY